jgi:GAF domain-containing protein
VSGLTGQSRLLESFGTPIAADLRSGRTLVIHDYVVDPRSAGAEVTKAWASIDLRAIIAVQLIKGGRFVALLYIHEPHPRAWRDDEVSLWKRSQIETGDAC